jgi:hypothetical protein
MMEVGTLTKVKVVMMMLIRSVMVVVMVGNLEVQRGGSHCSLGEISA